MSADVDHDVDMDDFFGDRRQYYVTGYYKLQLTVHTPEGDSYDLEGYFDHVTDAETWIEQHNQEYIMEQEREEEDRIAREEEELELDRIAREEEEEQIEREHMERHSLL